jgi:hypothetical protein
MLGTELYGRITQLLKTHEEHAEYQSLTPMQNCLLNSMSHLVEHFYPASHRKAKQVLALLSECSVDELEDKINVLPPNHPAKTPFSLAVLGGKKEAGKAIACLAQRLYLAMEWHQGEITNILASIQESEMVVDFDDWDEDGEYEGFCGCCDDEREYADFLI